MFVSNSELCTGDGGRFREYLPRLLSPGKLLFLVKGASADPSSCPAGKIKQS